MAKDGKEYTDFILRELHKGNVTFTDVSLPFFTKFNLSKPTFSKYWKIANETYSKYIEERQTQISEATTNETISTLSNGLKTKSERLLNLQKQIENLETELRNNVMHVHAFSMGEMVIGTREMNSLEKAKIADTIKGLQSEISKIEGDYAPTKQDVKLEDTRPSTKIKLNDGTEIEM